MQLNADLFLALRYLRPKRTFISVITLLSVLGPVLGVALLVIVTAVMSGFDRDIRDRILGMQAHLQVLPPPFTSSGRDAPIEDPGPVLAELERLGAHGSPLIEGAVLFQMRQDVSAKYVKGVIPETEKRVTDISRNVRGRFDLREGEALVGEEMAFEVGIELGDRVLIHAPTKLTRGIRWNDDGSVVAREIDEVYLPEEATVVGIFSLGLYEYDSSIIFVHADQAAELFGQDWGSATSVHARVPDPFDMEGIRTGLQSAFPQYRVVTWQEANERLFGALRVEKNLMFFLLFFIVLVAAFGISGTLITVVVQKTREIGVLKAVGMSSAMVSRVFVLQGTAIGLFGTSLGTGLGLIVVRYRNQVAAVLAGVMGVEIFPKELYHLSQIPALVLKSDVIIIVGSALVICVCGSLIPALYASLLSPAVALQEEN